MFRRMLLTAAVTVITLSPVAASSRGNTGVYKQTLPGIAWVLTEKPHAKKPGLYEGTAWVIDKHNRLLMTNHHVVEDARTINIFFPQTKGGTLMTDREWYVKHGRAIRAKVVLADSSRDLAIIQVDMLPNGVKELTLASASPEVGDEVYTVGNPGIEDELWVGNASTVKSVKRETIVTREGGRFVGTRSESKLAISPGASGSPVVNANGEVVGVVFCGDFMKAGEPAIRTFSVDVIEIRTVFTAAGKKLGDNDTSDARDSLRKGIPEGRGMKGALRAIAG